MRPNFRNPGKSWCSANPLAEITVPVRVSLRPCPASSCRAAGRSWATFPKHDGASDKSRVLVGGSCQAPIAAACIDRCNRTAIAVQRIRRDNLALERDQAKHLERRLQFATMVGGHRGQRQAQPRG